MADRDKTPRGVQCEWSGCVVVNASMTSIWVRELNDFEAIKSPTKLICGSSGAAMVVNVWMVQRWMTRVISLNTEVGMLFVDLERVICG